MLTRIVVLALTLALWPAASQNPEPTLDPQPEDIKLPSGKSQRDEILKAEHQKSLRDIAQIRKLAEELQSDLEKNDYHVLSISSLKKTEEIEKLAHRIRGRMKR